MCKSNCLRLLSYTVFAAIALVSALSPAAETATSEWVRPGSDGKLAYKLTPTGDRIMDFSHAGYMGGGVALPNVPVKQTVKPSGGEDDAAVIQAAIDEVSKLPLDGNFRGAVLLKPGVYSCPRPITISASGVVLRGSGSGAKDGAKSTLKLTGRPHGALAIRGAGGGRRGGGGGAAPAAPTADAQPAPDGFKPAETKIADDYVAAGATAFKVADASGLAVGDTVVIRRPVTEEWVKFMQMHDMTRDNRPQTWMRAGTTTTAERQIAAIDGNTIKLDVPLSDSYDARYLNPPGVTVEKIRPPARVMQSGVENLHIECPLQEISHSQPHFTAMRINGQDCWVRDVVCDETMNSIGIGGRRITLQNVAVNRKARHQGASRPAEFAPNGGQVLLDRCSVNADNIWFVAQGGNVAGPVVVLNCDFKGVSRAETHQRWSTGLMFDSCRAPEGGIELRNRGSMGSGHGWSMGWGVAWNCLAKDYIIQNPPGSANWMIGCIGNSKLSPRPFGTGPNLAEGTVDSAGKHVAPQSLYLAQLRDRLGPQALKNIGYDVDGLGSSVGVLAAAPSVETRIAADKVLGRDLAMHCPVNAGNVRGGTSQFNGDKAVDGDDKTYWATNDGGGRATLEVDTEGAVEINALEIGEAIGLEGRVQQYRVEGQVDSDWKLLSEGTTVGQSKVDRFPKVTVWKVRVTIQKSQEYPAIRKFALYKVDE